MATLLKTGRKLRAIELGREFGIDALEMKERDQQELRPHQVRVKMKAVSLNYRDLLVVKGQYKATFSGASGDRRLTPCSDGAGEVAEVGDGVTRVKVGDRVAGAFMQRWISGEVDADASHSALGGAIDGVLAEWVVFDEQGLVKVPEHLSYEEGATLPCAAVTAWNALIYNGKVKPGDVVLTMGTGGVSLFAAQFAQMAGCRVILTSSSDEKLQRVNKELGITDLINYRSNEDWEKEVLRLTNKRGVDHTIELGGAGTLTRTLSATRIGGRISLIGVLAGAQGQMNPISILMKHICLQGIFVGSREMFEHMNTAISCHHMKPVVDKVFSFDETKKAFQHMESQSHFGKIVIRL